MLMVTGVWGVRFALVWLKDVTLHKNKLFNISRRSCGPDHINLDGTVNSKINMSRLGIAKNGVVGKYNGQEATIYSQIKGKVGITSIMA
jgi:hypothetical protein